MKLISKLLTILLSLPFFSMAQNNYKPGSVINLKGDTIRGFIDYRGWDSNPTEISFKSALGDTVSKRLRVSDITFFVIDGLTTYKRYICRMSMDGTDIDHLTNGRDTTYHIGTVFLKVLQSGKNIALYTYTDRLKTRYYVSDRLDDSPVELVYRIYHDYQVTNNLERNISVESTYRKQLIALAYKYNMQDDKLISAVQKSDYTEFDLLEIVSEINGLSKSEFKKRYSIPLKVNFYAGLGLNKSSTSSYAGSSYSTDGGGPSTSYKPVVLAGINLAPNPVADNFELCSELMLTQTQFNSEYNLTGRTGVIQRSAFHQNQILLDIFGIYNIYNGNSVQFYIGGGAALSFFSYNNIFYGNNKDGSDSATNPYYFSDFETSLLFKTGIKLKRRFELFLNYIPSVLTTQNDYFLFANTRSQIGFIYHFGK